MKRKYSLLKGLLVVLVFVAAGLIYSCSRSETDRQDPDVIIYDGSDALDEASLSDHGNDGTTAETDEPTTAAQICIHICGAVVRPGIYFLDEGARVFEAVEMAGGFLEGAAGDYINLADHLSDASQLYIPFEGEEYIPAVQADDGLVNINTASAGELMTLPGIGQVKADAIINYREQSGPFAGIGDIVNVPGIKENTFEKIKNYIKVQ